MKLVEQHIIKSNDPRYNDLLNILSKSKNLYNTAIYVIRQHYFNFNNQNFTEDICSDCKYEYVNFFEVNKRLKEKENECYRALPANTSQEVLKAVDRNWKSFFGLLKAKREGKYTDKINFPHYLKSNYYPVVYNRMTLNQDHSKTGVIRLPKTKLEFKINHKQLQQVRFIPCNGYITMEVIYDVKDKELLKDNQRYAAIDLGIDNLATVTSNVSKAYIINGKPLKSINHFYNKRKAKLQSQLTDKQYTSKRITKLTNKRNRRVKDYMHNASAYIINQLVKDDIHTLIIGKNNHWKQETNMGSKNNQNFVSIPHSTFINLLSYKCKLRGIKVVLQEESYTSKASFFDNDYIPVYKNLPDDWKPSGKRIKRGLYKSSKGICINADVNGSLNILRKYLNVSSDRIISERSIGCVISPYRINLPILKKQYKF